MNKKLFVNEIRGGIGVNVMSDTQTASGNYVNGEYYDIERTTTTLSLDTFSVENQIRSFLTGMGQPMIQEELKKALIANVRFEVITWKDEDNTPIITVQAFFGDKLIGEVTNSKETKDGENVHP